MRAWGLFLCPPKNTPTPSTLNSPRGRGNIPGATKPHPLRDHRAHTHTPAITGHGTGQGTIGAQGHAWGARTTHANEATRSTLHRCNDVEHSSKHDKAYEHNSVRAAAVKRTTTTSNTARCDTGTLSSAAQQRNAKNLQRCKRQPTRQGDASATAKRHDNAMRITFSINNTMQQGCDSTGEQSASHKPTFTKASTR